MDRTTLTLAGLALANVTLWLWGGGPAPPDPRELQSAVEVRERDLPAREQTALWAARIRPALSEPDPPAPATFLAQLRAVAGVGGVELTEAAQRGGEPASLVLTGHGPFAGVARLLDEAGRPSASKIDGLDLLARADGRVGFELRLVLRHGAWVGPPQPQRDEPWPAMTLPRLAGADPFGGVAPVPGVASAPVVRPQRAMRYLGCHQGPGGTTVIVEEGTRAMLLRVGDRLPGGGRLVSADPARIGIEDEGGSRWHVAMERTP
jgi:hypothetical protein